MSYPPPGWGSGYPAPQPVPRPGVIPLRPLNLGDLLGGAFATIRRYPVPMLGVSAVLGLVVGLSDYAVLRTIGGDIAEAEEAANAGDVAALTEALAGVVWPFLLRLAVAWAGTVILTGVLTVVIGRAVLGRPITVTEAWEQVRPRILRLLGLSVAVGMVIAAPWLFAGLLVALASGPLSPNETAALAAMLLVVTFPIIVSLYIYLALSSASLILETTPDGRPMGVFAAMLRSARLVRGDWWRTFGVLLLVAVAAGIAASAVTAIISAVGGGIAGVEVGSSTAIAALIVSLLGSAASTAITAPVAAAVTVLIYVDRRIRTERLDIELARATGHDYPGGGATA